MNTFYAGAKIKNICNSYKPNGYLCLPGNTGTPTSAPERAPCTVFPTEKNYLTTTNRKYEKESDNLLGTVGSRKKYNC
jgi:hypothetical protein